MTSETVSMISAGIALLAAAGAWGAVVVNRWNAKDTIRAQINTGARTSRAAVVSANRQKWIDAIRDDVAEFISVRKLDAYRTKLAQHMHRIEPTHEEQMETLIIKERLLARIEMRLNWTGPKAEDDHKALVAALQDYAENPGREGSVKTISSKIFKDEWERLKKEASGIDPFVREALPERR
jgi:hypothetical protein